MDASQPDPAPSVARFLSDTGGRCPGCGYELGGRGPASDTCPECGLAVRLIIDPRGAGRAWWLLACLGSACSAGIMLLALADAVRRIWTYHATTSMGMVAAGFEPALRAQWRPVFVMAGLLVLTLALTAWALAARPQFAAWSRPTRALAGLLLGALPLVMIVAVWAFGTWDR